MDEQYNRGGAVGHHSSVSIDLNHNASAKILNPLAGISPEDLDYQVTEFARDKQLDDLLRLLKKGARVAQNPKQYSSIADLDKSELNALDDEVHHRWRQPKSLYFTVIMCSIGAAVQ
jgi:hypothetical protein